ncbi:hypothetical protein GQ55_6G154700 [Panicum hallii var. hallii]|uniref:Endonuclease/exonuclease/phosphatase domain-containing protein n=1 Tax=Panicum hallii var. hallii TaxID=1504633 RepID=A0A2T7D6E2_9POAL|nr:hypothetical protein GQ55_6G154700 [Panicum hallii var. hallii]
MVEWDGPTLLGGDFNLIRNAAEKNNDNIIYHWSDSFNDWINHWDLIELKNPNRSYTWTNNQEQPIMAVLDRVFATTDFEAHYPMINVKGASRLGSDHVPLVVNFGISQEKKPFLFRFEKWWLEQDDFHDIVKNVCESPCHYTDALDVWQYKLTSRRRKLKGWSLNINADLRRKKQAPLEEFDVLDVFSEESSLEENEKARMQEAKQELEHIWQMEEIKAKQRSRDRFIKGDQNTSYFQALANQRRRKKNISVLQGPEGDCTDNKSMLEPPTFIKSFLVMRRNLTFISRTPFGRVMRWCQLRKMNYWMPPSLKWKLKQPFFAHMLTGHQAQMVSLFCSIRNFGT